ncbi:hypothetical protein AcW2_005583 [Taiwanofungus camphoratus]|nr:hypothetical protein AcW2_005583 [Antrodia cinnamomea]
MAGHMSAILCSEHEEFPDQQQPIANTPDGQSREIQCGDAPGDDRMYLPVLPQMRILMCMDHLHHPDMIRDHRVDSRWLIVPKAGAAGSHRPILASSSECRVSSFARRATLAATAHSLPYIEQQRCEITGCQPSRHG